MANLPHPPLRSPIEVESLTFVTSSSSLTSGGVVDQAPSSTSSSSLSSIAYPWFSVSDDWPTVVKSHTDFLLRPKSPKELCPEPLLTSHSMNRSALAEAPPSPLSPSDPKCEGGTSCRQKSPTLHLRSFLRPWSIPLLQHPSALQSGRWVVDHKAIELDSSSHQIKVLPQLQIEVGSNTILCFQSKPAWSWRRICFSLDVFVVEMTS